MAKYRKKPVVIEARQLADGNFDEILGWVDGGNETLTGIEVPTLEGVMLATLGDWIIQGVKGEFYPCKPDIFEATYEPEYPAEGE